MINIEKIKDDFDELDLFDEKEIKRLKKKKVESGTNSIYFSQIFLLGYDTFSDNSHFIKNKSINSYLDKSKEIAEKIRNLIEEYGGGGELGDNFVIQKIKEQVKNHRLAMNGIIVLFSRVFLGED